MPSPGSRTGQTSSFDLLDRKDNVDESMISLIETTNPLYDFTAPNSLSELYLGSSRGPAAAACLALNTEQCVACMHLSPKARGLVYIGRSMPQPDYDEGFGRTTDHPPTPPSQDSPSTAWTPPQHHRPTWRSHRRPRPADRCLRRDLPRRSRLNTCHLLILISIRI